MSETVEYPPATGADSHLLTVMIADVRGYSQFTHERGDEAGARLAGSFADLARQVVGEAGGNVLEIRGDEALAVFPSARRAARGAVELQARCAEAIAHDPSLPLKVGIGLDAGEVVPVEEGYRGRALNVAARLCSLAKPGEIFAGEGLVHLAGVVDGLSFVSRRGVELKGVGQVQVYQLGRTGELPERLPPLETQKENSAPGAILANVAGAGGIALILIELPFNATTVGFLLRIGFAAAMCFASLAGARLSPRGQVQGAEWIYLIAAFTMVITLQWVGAIPAILFLVAAGMEFFGGGGSGGQPPQLPPPRP